MIDEQAPQRRYSLREVFNALRWLARAGAPWRLVPHDLPPWAVVYQQFRRWEDSRLWAAAGFKDTLLRWKMKPEVDHGNEKAIQPRVQA